MKFRIGQDVLVDVRNTQIPHGKNPKNRIRCIIIGLDESEPMKRIQFDIGDGVQIAFGLATESEIRPCSDGEPQITARKGVSMSQAKHTPGPWVVEDEGDAVETVAHKFGEDWGTMICCRIDNPADARLIAAAPDLLVALGRIVRRGPSEDCGDHCPAGCMFCQGRAAIAEATGESA